MKSERISPFWVNGYQPFSADKACELAEKYKGRDSYSEIYKAIKKVSESL